MELELKEINDEHYMELTPQIAIESQDFLNIYMYEQKRYNTSFE